MRFDLALSGCVWLVLGFDFEFGDLEIVGT